MGFMTTDITENTETSNTAQTEASNTAQTDNTAQTEASNTAQTEASNTAQTEASNTAQTETSNTAQTETSNTAQTQSSGPRDTVFIGKKPLMAYVTTTIIQLANLPSVSIKARGMSIGRAVDVAQIVSRKTENAGYTVGKILIGSETLESKDGRPRNVSTIEIEVKRN